VCNSNDASKFTGIKPGLHGNVAWNFIGNTQSREHEQIADFQFCCVALLFIFPALVIEKHRLIET